MRRLVSCGIIVGSILLAGCGGSGASNPISPLLAKVYTGQLSLDECGVEPCIVQFEPIANLGAVSGDVTVFNVNDRRLWRGRFAGSILGSEILGSVVLTGPEGTLGTLALELDASPEALEGAFSLTHDGETRTGTFASLATSGQEFNLLGQWEGFVEFSDNFDFYDATLLLDQLQDGLAMGEARWNEVVEVTDVVLPVLIRSLLGGSAYLDPDTGIVFAMDVEAEGSAVSMRLVVFHPSGMWTAFDFFRVVAG